MIDVEGKSYGKQGIKTLLCFYEDNTPLYEDDTK
jgi:hypothetical protein